MAYVIASPCVADFSCVEICPVAAISPGPDSRYFDNVEQLYIDPLSCIDCGACQDACPVSAIFPEGALPSKWAHYADINRQFFAVAVL
ncbi:ferredoxin family protein [Novosphingobium sp.]|uniref:4Fe-4S dicluster domain-containing protein n=1 Tax=Novosphingobium sp. TaxID=1874826 RepID=UPI0038BD83FF